jgi:hypothetical protein
LKRIEQLEWRNVRRQRRSDERKMVERIEKTLKLKKKVFLEYRVKECMSEYRV